MIPLSYTRSERGFTLVELLVVIVIIGILASVAISLYLGQKKRAHDAVLKSDIRNAAMVMETACTTEKGYSGIGEERRGDHCHWVFEHL